MLPLLSQTVLPGGSIRRRHIREIDFMAATEALIRSAIAGCSPQLLVPSLPLSAVRLGAEMKPSKLPPSLRRRIKILDRSDRIWKAIQTYFGPIAKATTQEKQIDISGLAWDLYLLVLATRASAQVHLDIEEDLKTVQALSRDPGITGEAAARIALLEGALRFFVPVEEMPGLCVQAGGEIAFRDRIEEVLEDAYLSEASSMRRFLSFESNLASVKRDLRSLLRSIVRNSKWAKGAISVAEQGVALPRVTTSAAGAVIEALDIGTAGPGPIVLDTLNPPWLSAFRVKPGHYRWDILVRRLEEELTKDSITIFSVTHDVYGEPSYFRRSKRGPQADA